MGLRERSALDELLQSEDSFVSGWLDLVDLNSCCHIVVSIFRLDIFMNSTALRISATPTHWLIFTRSFSSALAMMTDMGISMEASMAPNPIPVRGMP